MSPSHHDGSLDAHTIQQLLIIVVCRFRPVFWMLSILRVLQSIDGDELGIYILLLNVLTSFPVSAVTLLVSTIWKPVMYE